MTSVAIEHAQVIDENDFKLFGKYSIVPSVQPTHATSDMYWAEDRLERQGEGSICIQAVAGTKWMDCTWYRFSR